MRIPVAQKINARRKRCLDRWGWHCVYCGTGLEVGTMTFDHIIPKSRGGGRGDNLVPACLRCNMLRSSFVSLGELDALMTQMQPIIAIAEKILKGEIKPGE